MKISRKLIQKIILENVKNHNIDPGCIPKGKIAKFNIYTGEPCNYTEEEKKQYYDYVEVAGCYDDNGVLRKFNTKTGKKCDPLAPSMSSFQSPEVDFTRRDTDSIPSQQQFSMAPVTNPIEFTAKLKPLEDINNSLKLSVKTSLWNMSAKDIKAHVDKLIQSKNISFEDLEVVLERIKYIESDEAVMDELSARYRKEYRDIKKKFSFVKAIIEAALEKITIEKSAKSAGVTPGEKLFVDRVVKVAIARVFSTLEGGFLEKTTRLFSEKYFDQIEKHFENVKKHDPVFSNNHMLARYFDETAQGIYSDDEFIQIMWKKYRLINKYVIKARPGFGNANTMASGKVPARPSTLEQYKDNIANFLGVDVENFKEQIKLAGIDSVDELLEMPTREEFQSIKEKLIDRFKKNVKFKFNFDLASVDKEDYKKAYKESVRIIDSNTTEIVKKAIISPITLGFYTSYDDTITINVPFFYKIFKYEQYAVDQNDNKPVEQSLKEEGRYTLKLLIGTLIHEILHAIDGQLFLVLTIPNKILKKYKTLRPTLGVDKEYQSYSMASDLSTISLGEENIKNVKTAFNKTYLEDSVIKALGEDYKQATGYPNMSNMVPVFLKASTGADGGNLHLAPNDHLGGKTTIDLHYDSSIAPNDHFKNQSLYYHFKKYNLLKSHIDYIIYYVYSWQTPDTDDAFIKRISNKLGYNMNAQEIKVRAYSLIQFAKSKGYDLYDRNSFNQFAKNYADKTDEIKKEVSDFSGFTRYLLDLHKPYAKNIFGHLIQDVKDRAYNIFIYFAGKDVQLTEIFLRHIIRKRILKVLLNERKSIKR